MSKKTMAKSIIDKIFEEANGLFLMHISSRSENEIAAVYTGLVAFLVAGFGSDNELCMELTPAYQRKIMRSVSKKEYDFCTSVLEHSYEQFREKGIEIQYKTEHWRNVLKDRYSGMMIDWLCMPQNDYSHNYMCEAFDRLAKTAINSIKNKNFPISSARFDTRSRNVVTSDDTCGQNKVFGSDYEQLYFEIDKLIQYSKDQLFTEYLKSTLIEAQQHPLEAMTLRKKVMANYGVYSKRMMASGEEVELNYQKAIYGNHEGADIKSPYSNDISLYNNTYTVDTISCKASTTSKIDSPFDILSKVIYIFGGIPGLLVISFTIASFIPSIVSDYIDIHSIVGNIITFAVGISIIILIDFIVMKFFWYDDIITSKGLAIYNFIWIIVSGVVVVCILLKSITWLELTVLIVSVIILEVFVIKKYHQLIEKV